MTKTSSRICLPRFATPRNPDRPTLGPAIAKVGERLNKPFMPWQRMVADVVGEVDPATGLLVYRTVIITVPRQSGKSTFVLAKATHRCTATGFFGPRQKLVYTAQTRLKAREKWEEDYAAELDASPTFKGRARASKASGNEHLRFQNGSRFGIESNTEKAGHGSTLDEAYIDEAFAQADGRLVQAFRPAMITRQNTQLVMVSTAGWSDASPWFLSQVEAGREAASRPDSSVAYFEWSAPDDADPDDPETWWGCMPALGHTVLEDAIRGEREAMDDADFRRAYLNQWVPKPREQVDDRPYPVASWAAVADPAGASLPLSGIVLAVDMPPDREAAAIASCGLRPDGMPQIELVDHRGGSEWVVERLRDVASRWPVRCVVVDGASSARSLIPAMENAGLKVEKTTGTDMGAACGDLFDALRDGTFRQVPHPDLDAAVSSARKRNLGDAWALNRRADGADISPLVAAVLARWVAVKTRTLTTDELLQTFY
jgi:phage terminase large subunit-like protein